MMSMFRCVIRVMIAGSCAAWATGCDGASKKYEQWVSLDGRKLTVTSESMTLDNGEQATTADKRIVVLTMKSAVDVGSEAPQLVEKGKLNVISGREKFCGGSVSRSGDMLTVGLTGTSDRCELYSGKWYIADSSAFAQALAQTQIPYDLHGTYRLGEATLEVDRASVTRQAPQEGDPAKRTVIMYVDDASTVAGVTAINSSHLNTITKAGKTCQGTVRASAEGVLVELRGNSDRCSLLSGNWSR